MHVSACTHTHTHKERLARLLQRMNVLYLQDRTSNVGIYFLKLSFLCISDQCTLLLKTNQMHRSVGFNNKYIGICCIISHVQEFKKFCVC